MESKDVSAGLGSLPIDMVNQEPALDLVAEQESGQDAVEEVHDPEADAAEVNSDDPEADAAAEVNSDDLAAAQEGSEATGEEVNSDVDSLPSVPKWFPTCLTKYLLNMLGGVQTVYREHRRLHPQEIKKQIRSLTQEIQGASSKEKENLKSLLRDKVWMLQNHKETARQEWMLRNPWSVYSLKRTNGEWKAEIWMSQTSTKIVPVNDRFVRQLICPFLLRDKRFTEGEFVPLHCYDRLSEVTETHFRSIRKVDKNLYELTDLKGRRAVIPSSYLSKCQSIAKRTMKEADMRFRQNDEKAVKIAPGSVACGVSALDDYVALVVSDITTAPEIIYKNGDDRREVELCLPFSLANGLLFLGYHEQAITISSSKAQGLGELGVDLRHDDGRPIRSKRVYFGEERYDPLNNGHRTPNPVVAVLEGTFTHGTSEGPVTTSLNHCVCFVGDWLFDVNQDEAKKISQKTLDHVTNLVMPGSAYGRVVEAREFMVNKERVTATRKRKNALRAKQRKRKRILEYSKKIKLEDVNQDEAAPGRVVDDERVTAMRKRKNALRAKRWKRKKLLEYSEKIDLENQRTLHGQRSTTKDE